MNLSKTIACFLFFVFTSVAALSQEGSGYTTAIGAKVSAGIAGSLKHFVRPTQAVELQTMFFNKGIRIIGLYEFHFYNIEGLGGLGWYVGPGAHLGFYYGRYKSVYNTIVDVGIDGVVGLDYRFNDVPLNISLDWQPSLGLIGKSGIQPQFGGLGIRYIIH